MPKAINPYVVPQNIHASIFIMKVSAFVVINKRGNKKEMADARYFLLEIMIDIPRTAAIAGMIPIVSKNGFISI
jgi:hypothetical protein